MKKNLRKKIYGFEIIKNFINEDKEYSILDLGCGKIPFFLDSSAHELNNIFDSTLKNEIQIKLNHGSIFLISHKNNEKNFNFSNNYETEKIYKKTSKTIAEEFRLIFPKKCN